ISLNVYLAILVALAAERLFELALSRRNARRALAAGAIEIARGQYAMMASFTRSSSYPLLPKRCSSTAHFLERSDGPHYAARSWPRHYGTGPWQRSAHDGTRALSFCPGLRQ